MLLAEITSPLSSAATAVTRQQLACSSATSSPTLPVQLSYANPQLDFEMQTRLINQRINQHDIAEVKAVVIRTCIMATGRQFRHLGNAVFRYSTAPLDGHG